MSFYQCDDSGRLFLACLSVAIYGGGWELGGGGVIIKVVGLLIHP
jgi:hypothetical protein